MGNSAGGESTRQIHCLSRGYSPGVGLERRQRTCSQDGVADDGARTSFVGELEESRK